MTVRLAIAKKVSANLDKLCNEYVHGSVDVRNITSKSLLAAMVWVYLREINKDRIC